MKQKDVQTTNGDKHISETFTWHPKENTAPRPVIKNPVETSKKDKETSGD